MLVDQLIESRPGMGAATGHDARLAVDEHLARLADAIELAESTRHVAKSADGKPVRKRDALRANWGVSAAKAAGSGDGT